jgi:hypothetical protein
MGRDPGTDVKRQLRREQGFVCAIPGCQNPYLVYHHFAPPWRVEHHHRPEDMIALCGEHHPKADAGAFTADQLRSYKQRAAIEAPAVKAKYDWLRHDLVLVSGGMFHVETPVAVEIGADPAVWFSRDDEGYALLNVRMPQSTRSQRVVIEDNFWIQRGNVCDLVSPPGGKSLEVSYANGDYLRIGFEEIADVVELTKRWPNAGSLALDVPMTAVEVMMRVPGLGVSLQADGIGASKINGVARGCRVGISLSTSRRPLPRRG